MSKPINPAALGGFTLGAMVLLVAGLLIFGGGQNFKTEKMRFVVFFDSSLNGLEMGAPVKMQGVKIGEVTEIALQFDPKRNKLFKPVVVEIDSNSLSGSRASKMPEDMTEEEEAVNRDRLVAVGFRARLETQSLLTGLLYVDLDVHPNQPPMFAELAYKGLLEIPGVPSTSDEIRSTAEELAQKIRSLPLDEMIHDLAASLREVKNLLASQDVQKSKVAFANTLEEIEKTTKILNRNLEPLLINTNKTMENTGALVQSLHDDIHPVLANTDKALLAATAALQKTELAMVNVGDAVGPQSPLTDSLQALKDASRAIRDLSDFLERHPEALLSGKKP